MIADLIGTDLNISSTLISTRIYENFTSFQCLQKFATNCLVYSHQSHNKAKTQYRRLNTDHAEDSSGVKNKWKLFHDFGFHKYVRFMTRNRWQPKDQPITEHLSRSSVLFHVSLETNLMSTKKGTYDFTDVRYRCLLRYLKEDDKVVSFTTVKRNKKSPRRLPMRHHLHVLSTRDQMS